MSIKFDKILLKKESVGFFRFKKLNDKILLTNDIFFIKLKEKEFQDFLEGKLDKKGDVYKELSEKGFVKDNFNDSKFIKSYVKKNNFLFKPGVSLHIVILTKRCNHTCVYCQAGRAENQKKDYDMTKDVAKKTVDLIFQTPSKIITIEFQGGEPLINWDVLKFIVEYANEKNKEYCKNLKFSLTTNLSLMTDEKYSYLIEKNVAICTSLDGPSHVHNKNRPFLNGKGTYPIVDNWMKKIGKNNGRSVVGALPTLTKYSLDHIEEVVDEYIDKGVFMIHLRQLSYLGCSSGEKSKEDFGYSIEEFIGAWKRAMDYIIEKNLQGIKISERGAVLMLERILGERTVNFLDFRSPCGAGIGQLAYFYDGNVYSCDEGRMTGDDTFLLGNVFNSKYEDIINNPKTKTLVTASTLENLTCDECVYKAYCGVCPLLNYVLYKNIFPNIKSTDKCKMHTAFFDYLFLKMEDKKVLEVFNNWLNRV